MRRQLDLAMEQADELADQIAVLDHAVRDDRTDSALRLRIPHDGGFRSLKAALDKLDANLIEVDSLSMHTPGLDDVFLAPHQQPRPAEGERAMTTATSGPLALTDSATMLRRNLLRMRRYPSMTALLLSMPIIFLLQFVYVFGGTFGAGVGGVSGGRAEYVNYVTPAIAFVLPAFAFGLVGYLWSTKLSNRESTH